MPLFCRHNRFQHNCPICSKEAAAARPAAAPARPRTGRASGTSTGPARPGRGRPGGLVVKRVERAADDGYASPLVPGIRGSGDAERLAGLIADEDERLVRLALEPPEPWAAVAAAEEFEAAAEVALGLVLADASRLGETHADERTVAAYRAWTGRSGGAAAAFTGDPAWTPARRFDRIFERLAFPGFGRPLRYALLVALGALGRVEVEAASLHFGVTGDDQATLAAKRVLNSGDTQLLDRRAAALADALGVPLATLDGAFAAFERGERADDDGAPALGRLRGALGLG